MTHPRFLRYRDPAYKAKSFKEKHRQQRMCLRKLDYDTEESAAQAIQRMVDRGAVEEGVMRVYVCPYCKKYHVGHKEVGAGR